jgi:GntR family transcriptional regulator of arabinose operon
MKLTVHQYQDAANRIRAYIQEKRLHLGDRLPAERVFADLLQVGRPTVNKAITCLISEGFLRREGYKLYVSTPPLRETRQLNIGVLCPHPLHRHQRVTHNLVEAAHDVCDQTRVRFTPMLSMDGAQQRAQLLEILGMEPDGVVIWPHDGESYHDLFKQLLGRGISLVVNDVNWGYCDYVGVDNFAGIRTVLTHLADLGHREVAYFTRQLNNPNLEERLEGYRYWSSKLVSEASTKRIYRLPAGDEPGALPELFRRFRMKESAVTAICCSHDSVALDLIRICLQSGIEVPERLSFAGFDGIDAGELSARPLTTVAQDFYQLGALAVDLLIRRIRLGHIKHSPQLQHIHLVPHLIVRESTAPPPSAKKSLR